MGNLIGVLGLLLAVVAVAATTTLTDAWDNLATWQPWAIVITTVVIALLATALGAAAADRRIRKLRDRVEKYASYVVISKTVRDKLLSWGAIDADDLSAKLDRLEASEEDAWIHDEARHARQVFLYHARRALRVRRDKEDYRNDMERSETKQYLDNATDRLVAALLKHKMPEAFDPYDEGEPSWGWRMGQPIRRILRLRNKADSSTDLWS
jgi:hypothetical protein